MSDRGSIPVWNRQFSGFLDLIPTEPVRVVVIPIPVSGTDRNHDVCECNKTCAIQLILKRFLVTSRQITGTKPCAATTLWNACTKSKQRPPLARMTFCDANNDNPSQRRPAGPTCWNDDSLQRRLSATTTLCNDPAIDGGWREWRE
jgi:hypothetical protein